MSHTLTSPYFQFTLNPENATWSLHGYERNAPFIEDAWMRISYHLGRQRYEALSNLQGVEIHGPKQAISPHGMLSRITLHLGPDKNGLHCQIEFALSDVHPLFFWRLSLENQGQHSLTIDQIKLLQAGFFPRRRYLPIPGRLSVRYQDLPVNAGTIRPHPDPGDLAFYSNGWQSWSFTGVLGNNQRLPDTCLGFFGAPIWYNPGTPRLKKRGHFASDMFGILGDRQHRTGILAGFLSQKQHFGSLEVRTDPIYPALALWANGDQAQLQPGSQMTTDWAAIQFVDIDDPDPLAPYLEAVARENNLQASASRQLPSIGWCSWYQFYQDISAEKIRLNLKAADEMRSVLPLDLFQIDDGFEAQIGDWFDFSPGFPEGVAPLAREIQDADFTPGLWLAPFIVHSKSRLKQERPNWILRNRWGWPVDAGFIWENFNTALDLTHPDALAYTEEVVHTATHDWGYQFLKLDFLYAGALKGCPHDKTLTRAQVLRRSLETLRAAAGPDVHLLGCGVPLGSSIGIFDSMRIGADVDPRWMPTIKGIGYFFKREYSLPSTRNAIQNALTRAPLHQHWWINDPDCLLVRPDSDLTLAEVQSQATVIALTGGPLLLSDDLPMLPAERLRIAEQLVPLLGKRGHALDWFDTATPRLLRLDLENCTGQWHLIAVFNWEDEAGDLSLPLEKLALPGDAYHVSEFWGRETSRVSEGVVTLMRIPAHGVKLLALREAHPDQACYLGSDLHISQGLEVTTWSEAPSRLELRLERPGKAQGLLDLTLPQPPVKVSLNQIEIPCQSLGEDLYRIPVEFDQSADLLITWE